MKVSALKLRNLLFLLIISGIFFFISCDQVTTSTEDTDSTSTSYSNADEEVQDQSDPAPSLEATRQFFFAWMADAANDQSAGIDDKKDAEDYLRGIATTKLTNALKDPKIYDVIGKDSLVWGPQIVISEEIGAPNPYVVKNLIYCVQSLDKDPVQYSIGIAGTNEISPFDWLHEDLLVNKDNMVAAHPAGKISQGAHIGLNALTGMKTPNGQTLVAFLQDAITKNSDAKITVAGHSLGGALTQVYSAHIKHDISPKPDVEAWVFAGPTAGNNEFATALNDYVDYHAYNNKFDVVPHAWQTDSLARVCRIYKNKTNCHWPIGENPLINAITRYTVDYSAGADYKIPGNPITFNGQLNPEPSIVSCADMLGGADAFWVAQSKLYKSLQTNLYRSSIDIMDKCGTPKDDQEASFLLFALFMSELGSQHTSAYVNYFFDNHKKGFKPAVANYVTPPKALFSNGTEGLEIAGKFIKRVDEYYETKTLDCTCNLGVVQ